MSSSKSDQLDRTFSLADPVSSDGPPTPGSARVEAIRASARSRRPLTPSGRGRSGMTALAASGGSRLRIGAMAACVALIAGLVVVNAGHGDTTASAAVAHAASRTGETTSLRAHLVVSGLDGSTRSSTGTFVGNDVQIVTVEATAGRVTSTESITVIGQTVWTETDGRISSRPVGPDDQLVPFVRASESVVKAALRSAVVTHLGDDLRGASNAREYVIDLGDRGREALAELSPKELAWFELEEPSEVTSIHLWVADGLIVKMRVLAATTSTIEFSDLNADIDLEPPHSGSGA